MVVAFTLLLLSWLAAVASMEPFSIQGHSDGALVRGELTIRCRLVDLCADNTVTQITWQRRMGRFPRNDNFMTVQLRNGAVYVASSSPEERECVKFVGDFEAGNADVLIRNARDEDAGTYTCIFSLFPAGNNKVQIEAKVWTKPRISVEVIPAVSDGGAAKRRVAVCTVEGGKPEPRLSWVRGNDTAIKKEDPDLATEETRESNPGRQGAVDVACALVGVARAELNGEKVVCVVASSDGGGVYAETADV